MVVRHAGFPGAPDGIPSPQPSPGGKGSEREGQSLIPASPMVVMGKVVGAQGIQGWVKVQTFTEYLDGLLDYDTWYVGSEQNWRPLEVLEANVHGGKVIIAKLQGVVDRTAAEKCKGLLIAIPRAQLPEQEEGEYYWSDLIGLAVENLQGMVFGTVDSLLETGANDVLVVKGEGGETLMPFIASVIQKVDLQGRKILVDWQADYLK
jgi:16S rRNA processing protein RimM